jgi:hypothetical protein
MPMKMSLRQAQTAIQPHCNPVQLLLRRDNVNGMASPEARNLSTAVAHLPQCSMSRGLLRAAAGCFAPLYANAAMGRFGQS